MDYTAILLIAMGLLTGLVVYFVSRSTKKVVRKRLSEGIPTSWVPRMLRKEGYLKQWKVLSPLVLSDKEGEFKVDHVVVGSFGILLVCPFSGRGDAVYGEIDGDRWRVYEGPEGNRKETVQVPNPYQALRRGTNATRATLEKASISGVPILTAVPRSGPQFVSISGGAELYNKKQFQKYLNGKPFAKELSLDTERIAALLMQQGEQT